MKRFLLLRWDTYYPGGGIHGDLAGSFDTLAEAISAEGEQNYRTDYAEVFDCDTRLIVWERE
jgi:hypothetical protein